jgi:hypothetical protein
MKLNLAWVVDPKTKEESVSLTLVVVFGLASLFTNILKATGKVDDVAGLNELFYSALALYFSRRNLSFGNKTYSASEAEELTKKVSE